MTQEINDKIAEMIEWKTSNQGLVKDGWKILKVYDKKCSNKKVQKYALIECIFCGHQKLVLYYYFINSNKVNYCSCLGLCKQEAKKLIGKAIGHYKILDFCEVKKGKNNSYMYYYDVECVKCHSKRNHALFNKNSWEDYYQGCPDCSRIKLSFYERRYKEYMQGAKARGYSWDLSYEQFCTLVVKNCVYCGAEPGFHSRSIGEKGSTSEGYMNGIDRIDSSKDYTTNNCVPCCSKCNQMKMDFSKDMFLNHIEKIYLFTKQGSTTISKESTLQANGSGNGGSPEMESDIV